MCPPSFFNVEHYLLNDHMTMSIPVDYYIAQNQWWMYYFKVRIHLTVTLSGRTYRKNMKK